MACLECRGKGWCEKCGVVGLAGVTPAEVARAEGRCPKCGQRDEGQTGEYPCAECGLPLTHDD